MMLKGIMNRVARWLSLKNTEHRQIQCWCHGTKYWTFDACIVRYSYHF